MAELHEHRPVPGRSAEIETPPVRRRDLPLLLLRWLGPALVAVLLSAGYIWGHGLWQRHNAQHTQAAQDHQALLQVIAFLNQQVAAAQTARPPTPPSR